ncbi:hypothetical protein B0H14DRAFT_2650872 [Mycena olivaceomarginata]|nr:hypothetical protein B0H14DRAFT_2650872 [Mycena olivaceomarginata]
MPSSTGSGSQRTAADLELVTMSDRDLTAFRNYIRSHAGIFLDQDWIDTAELRQFLHQQRASAPTYVKLETSDSGPCVPGSSLAVKSESVHALNPVRTRLLQEDGHDVLEILSDSESDNDLLEVSRSLMGASRSSKHSDSESESDPDFVSDSDDELFSGQSRAAAQLQQSDTIWQDPGITSPVLIGKFRLNIKTTVERIEYVMPYGRILSIWLNLRVPTAFVLNLGSNYDTIDPKTGEFYTVDWRKRLKCRGCERVEADIPAHLMRSKSGDMPSNQPKLANADFSATEAIMRCVARKKAILAKMGQNSGKWAKMAVF